MVQQIFGSRKSIVFVLVGVVVLALFTLAWRIVSLQQAASEATVEPVLKISYCGAEPEELCVLSFGRDVDENMVVNLFVPDRKFPAFYLKIQRATRESTYECEKDKEVQSSIFCYGDMANLQERMQVSIFAKADDHLLAAGAFTLKAILVSESSSAGVANTPTAAPGLDESPTSTEISTDVAKTATPTLTPTLTPTPDVSYPDSSYP